METVYLLLLAIDIYYHPLALIDVSGSTARDGNGLQMDVHGRAPIDGNVQQ